MARSIEDIDIEIIETVNEKQEIVKSYDRQIKRLRAERAFKVLKEANAQVTSVKCVCYYEKGELIKSGRCAIHGLLALKLLDKDVTYEPNRNK